MTLHFLQNLSPDNNFLEIWSRLAGSGWSQIIVIALQITLLYHTLTEILGDHRCRYGIVESG